ncbi:hypothetical protein [Nocardia arizonensis]|uniref:hypothetical protein n=1 Tax=Nocardia arizonensis TaxID=1141647 RepID=UPI0007A742AF|nr:hypothetical protein [Nocardia arizonensis]
MEPASVVITERVSSVFAVKFTGAVTAGFGAAPAVPDTTPVATVSNAATTASFLILIDLHSLI